MKEELTVTQYEKDFEKILEEAKGKRNVILANIKAIGMKGILILYCNCSIGTNIVLTNIV